MSDLTVEHIDPRNGVLVSGLCNEFNEVLVDLSYNARKTNRFVPYRIHDYHPPVTFGDVGEFLIEGGWVVCEFGGPEWWAESNKIGNATTKGGETVMQDPENRRKASERGKLKNMGEVGSRQPREIRQKNGRKAGLARRKPIEVTFLSTGESFHFASAKEAALSFGVPQVSMSRSARNNKPYKCFQARYL